MTCAELEFSVPIVLLCSRSLRDMPGEALFMKLVFGYASVGTILVFGASDFPYFF